MSKIITAIGNRNLNDSLKEIEHVFSKDIQYQDGVIEILNEFKDIEKILLSTEILGEYEFDEFIEKILELQKNIEIVIFAKNKEKLDFNFLNSKGIYKIYTNNENGFYEYIESIEKKEKTITEEIKKEIYYLKKNIKQANNNKLNNRFYKKLKENNIETKSNVISICGSAGVREKYIFNNFF